MKSLFLFLFLALMLSSCATESVALTKKDAALEQIRAISKEHGAIEGAIIT